MTDNAPAPVPPPSPRVGSNAGLGHLVLALLYGLTGFILLLVGLVALAVAPAVGGALAVFGASGLVLAGGLARRRPWAWVLCLAHATLSIVADIVAVAMGLLDLVPVLVHLGVIVYLFVAKDKFDSAPRPAEGPLFGTIPKPRAMAPIPRATLPPRDGRLRLAWAVAAIDAAGALALLAWGALRVEVAPILGATLLAAFAFGLSRQDSAVWFFAFAGHAVAGALLILTVGVGDPSGTERILRVLLGIAAAASAWALYRGRDHFPSAAEQKRAAAPDSQQG